VSDDRVLVLGGPSEGLASLADETFLEPVEGLEECLGHLGAGTRTVGLVVIDPAWPQPLAAVREIRRVDAGVGLVIATPADGVAGMRSRVAFLPGAGEVGVVAADLAPRRLRGQLEELTTAVRRRQRVRRALDAINRDLAHEPPPGGAGTGASSVSEHYLAALVRHAADTIVSVDPDGRLVTVNEAGQRTLGLDPVAAEGRPLGELLAPDDPGALVEMLRAATAEVQVEEEIPAHLAHGPRVVLSATAAPVVDDGGSLAGLVLIARDVTAERQAEQRLQALQKAETLATLASGVAHDFNNLLVQVQGWSDLAAEDPSDTGMVSEALEHIGEATRRASELARAMLAYGGRGRFEVELIRVGGLLADLMPLLAAAVPAKIRLETDLVEDPEVRADATQLRQVVLNLVTNASEAIGEHVGVILLRTGTVTLEHGGTAEGVEHPLADGRYAFIEVVDDGPGVEPGHEHRLFDPFFTTKFTGRGLGLAASQGIARAHGGGIAVDSRPGAGARFRVHLPMTG
jgi:PAS domain S-box-containing protein